MYLFIKYVIIALMLKLSYSALVNRQDTVKGFVKGLVRVNPTTPLKNVVVSLASDSMVVRMTRTNEKGYFLFDKLPKGNYRILIMITGYEKYTTGFFSLTTAKPSREFKDIELQPSSQESIHL